MRQDETARGERVDNGAGALGDAHHLDDVAMIRSGLEKELGARGDGRSSQMKPPKVRLLPSDQQPSQRE